MRDRKSYVFLMKTYNFTFLGHTRLVE